MADRMHISATRLMKNTKYLLEHAPELIDPEKAKRAGLDVLTPDQIRVIHDPVRRQSVGLSESQKKVLTSPQFKTLSLKFDGGLFAGTVHVVDLSFEITGENNRLVQQAPGSIATIIDYLMVAAGSVSQYVSQYGAHSVSINQTPLVATVKTPSTSYNMGSLEDWVKAIAKDSNTPPNDCICIINPPEMINTGAKLSAGIGGFHEKSGWPYIFVNIDDSGASQFTIQDPDLMYADSLSHELAEMIVDPNANLSNPEVCDPCAGNCNNFFANCFKVGGTFLGTAPKGNFTFPFDYFISAVVQPVSAKKCPAPEVTCAYFPQIWSPLGGPQLQQLAPAIAPQTSVAVVGLGKDGETYLITQSGGQWSGWTSLLGTKLKQLAAANNQDGRLQIFAVGGDGALYSIWQTPPNNVWGQWESLQGKDITQIVALPDANHILVVLALDKQGAVSVISQAAANGGWGVWSPLQGNALQQITAAVDAQGQLVLFALGGDKEVYFRVRASNGTWMQWSGIPGIKLLQFAVSRSPGSSGLVLFGVDTGRSAWMNAELAGVWGAWEPLNGSQLKGVAAVSGNDGTSLFALGGDNEAYRRTQSIGGNWNDWAGVGATELLDFLQLCPIIDGNAVLQLFGLSSSGELCQILPDSPSGHT